MEKIIKVCQISGLLILFCLLTILTSHKIGAEELEKQNLKIVTSFYPMYAITKEVVGDVHDVKVINSRNGIHGFEPSANDIAGIHNADIFIYHSNTLESWTENIQKKLNDSSVIMVEASRGMDLMKVQGLEDVEIVEGMDSESLYDPHSWLDPIEASIEANLIADKLSELDPKNKDIYQNNAAKFSQKSQELVDKYQPIFDNLKQKTFVTQHTAFSYLAKRFGLKQLGISGVSSDIEPSSKKLIEVQNFVKENQIKTIFVEPSVSDKAAKIIAKSTNTRIVELSPLESDPQNQDSYLTNLENVLKVLSQTLMEEE